MKLITRIIISTVFLFGAVAVPAFAFTESSFAVTQKEAVCEGIGGCDDNNTDPDKTAASKVQKLITNIINIMSWAGGVICVIMVMLGGFWYLTSNGDAAKVTRGRQTITYALVGLVIIALAQAIVRFVIGAIFKA